MNKISPAIVTEFHFSTSRSGGKGGQHVNTTESKVELTFLVSASQYLTDEQKRLIIEKLTGKLDNEGYWRLYEHRSRSQHVNKETLIKRALQILAKCLVKPKKRIATKVSKSAKAKRLDKKKKHGEIKKLRSKRIDY